MNKNDSTVKIEKKLFETGLHMKLFKRFYGQSPATFLTIIFIDESNKYFVYCHPAKLSDIFVL